MASCATSTPPTAHTQAQALEENRLQAERLIAQAQVQINNGQIEDAINLYKQSVSLYPQDAFAWYNLGVLCSRQKRFAESAEAWNMATTLDAKDPRAYFALGLQVQELGWLSDASEFYNRALDRDPNYLPALKKSVQVDQLTDSYKDVTLERIRRALLQETDPAWVDYLRRMQLKTQERVARSGGNTGH
jgi:tetratricopeptide (TPR) repeat protein